jgi:NTP pyrophosphatase (non-canonical NTP hydrolase)
VNQKGKVMTLQKQVLTWAEGQFGRKPEIAIAIRGNKEMAELVSTIANGLTKKSIGEECADVAFFLIQICEKNGFDLMKEVEAKLVINRKRQWAKGSDGSDQHVEGT